MPASSLPPTRSGRPRSRSEPLGIKAVEQALDVVDALVRSDGPRSLTDLASDIGMDVGKLHRYLVSLCRRGLAKRIEGSGLYDIGSGALSLGVTALARMDEFEVIRSATNALCQTLKQDTFFYVWSGAGPVLVYNRRPGYGMISLRLGSIVPLVRSATGPIFVTYLPEELTAPIVARDVADKGLDLENERRALAEAICPRIRKERVMWSDATVVPDSAACAAPIFDIQGNLISVLGASFYMHGRPKPLQSEVIQAVHDAAAKASGELGFVSQK